MQRGRVPLRGNGEAGGGEQRNLPRFSFLNELPAKTASWTGLLPFAVHTEVIRTGGTGWLGGWAHGPSIDIKTRFDVIHRRLQAPGPAPWQPWPPGQVQVGLAQSGQSGQSQSYDFLTCRFHDFSSTQNARTGTGRLLSMGQPYCTCTVYTVVGLQLLLLFDARWQLGHW